MPILYSNNNLTIKMYFKQSEHNPPHIHVFYGENIAIVGIKNGQILEGYITNKQLNFIQNWITKNKFQLLKMWETQNFYKLK